MVDADEAIARSLCHPTIHGPWLSKIYQRWGRRTALTRMDWIRQRGRQKPQDARWPGKAAK